MKNILCLLKDDIINLQMKTARQSRKMNCIPRLFPRSMALPPLSILAANRGSPGKRGLMLLNHYVTFALLLFWNIYYVSLHLSKIIVHLNFCKTKILLVNSIFFKIDHEFNNIMRN